MAGDEEKQQKKPGPSHLLVFHVVTAGKNGEKLGSDEEQIVLLTYLLYDVANRKVSTNLKQNAQNAMQMCHCFDEIDYHDSDRCSNKSKTTINMCE